MPMVFRSHVGFKPARRPAGESSEELDKAMFVQQWGGAVMDVNTLPQAVKDAFAQIAVMEAEKQQKEENAR